LVHLFQLKLQSYLLTLYLLDGAALARCTVLIGDPWRGNLRCRANGGPPSCGRVPGHFFDRATDKLNQLSRFATNELVPFDLQAVASVVVTSAFA
jgi:hypothetical protein